MTKLFLLAVFLAVFLVLPRMSPPGPDSVDITAGIREGLSLQEAEDEATNPALHRGYSRNPLHWLTCKLRTKT